LKLVQERVGNTLEAIGIGKDFLSRAQMAQQLREMIDKWDYMKSKSFCSTKEMVSKLKKLPTEWEKIFASYISDKELITKIYKVLKKLNSQKINDPMKKWVNGVNRALLKEEVKMNKKYMKNVHHTWS
jgi:Mg/Co/Ni transporter MgtE